MDMDRCIESRSLSLSSHCCISLSLDGVPDEHRVLKNTGSSLLGLAVLLRQHVAKAGCDDLRRPVARVERLLASLRSIEDRLVQAGARAGIARKPAVEVEVVIDELAPEHRDGRPRPLDLERAPGRAVWCNLYTWRRATRVTRAGACKCGYACVRDRMRCVCLRSAVNIPPQECYLDWPGDQYRGPKAEDLW